MAGPADPAPAAGNPPPPQSPLPRQGSRDAAGVEPTGVAIGYDAAVAAGRPRRVGRWVAIALVLVLCLAAVAVAGLWATDYQVTADVEDTRCDLGQVSVRTRQLGIAHTVRDVPLTQCLLVEPGDFVQYRIRTQRTTLYDATGDCVYDSVTGPC